MAATLDLIIKAHDQVSGTFKDIGKNTDGLGSKFALLGAAVGGAVAGFLSIKTIAGAINTTQQLGSEVSKLTRETGLSSEEASRLLFAFKRYGLAGDDASRSLGILAKKLKGVSDEETGVTTGGKSTAAILADIGVKATDAAGNLLPISSLIPDIADKFKAMPDGIEKTGLAMQLFGRSGKDMIPVLNQGSEGLEKLGETADKLGLTLSAENLQKIKDYSASQRFLNQAIAGLKLEIGLALMPVLTKFAQWLVANQPAIRAFMHDAIEDAKPIIADVANIIVGEFVPALDQLKQTIDGITPTVEKIIGFFKDNPMLLIPLIAGLTTLAVVFASPVVAIVAVIAAGTLLLAHWDEIRQKVTQFVTDFKEKFPVLVEIVTIAFELIKNRVEFYVSAVKDIINIVMALLHGDWGRAWQGIKDLGMRIFQAFRDEFGLLLQGVVVVARQIMPLAKDAITGALQGALDFMRGLPGQFAQVGADIANAILAGFKAAWNAAAGAINSAIPNSIGIDIPGADLGPFGKIGGQHIGIDLPDNPIPTLAAGGIVTRPTLALIAERGPEAVIPLGQGGMGGTYNFYYQPMYSSATPAEADVFGKAVAQVLRQQMGMA